MVAPGHLKQELLRAEHQEVPQQDWWRTAYLRKLLEQRLVAHYSGDLNQEERLESLINSLVIN